MLKCNNENHLRAMVLDWKLKWTGRVERVVISRNWISRVVTFFLSLIDQ